jgi:hypothetical protein
MQKPRDNIKNGALGIEENSLLRGSNLKKQVSNLVLSKKPELQTADKILRYMLEEY